MEYVALLLAPIILVILGIIIGSGKGGFLIAGYNTLDKNEQDKYDKERYFKFMGKFLFVLAGIELIMPIAKVLNIGNFGVVIISVNIIFVIVVIGGIIYMNTKNRFKK
ncbi:DUF3784 domain-containing protein [uncultured Clostridium sp.]|uniref:DUF3784 domain-containing protein n=1 Tax=uncultured Clostridium sp. TaxID=59620 RepID=UPI002612DE88|nr:DUF3784 domain-containing protein [uncultured Clostridium sp.]